MGVSSMNEGTGLGRVERLSQLLEEAHTAHSVYEKDVLHGVWDEEWPAWYAGYLATHGILDLVAWDSQGREPPEGLALLLTEADRLHQSTAPEQHWPHFYARYLLGFDLAGGASPTETETK